MLKINKFSILTYILIVAAVLIFYYKFRVFQKATTEIYIPLRVINLGRIVASKKPEEVNFLIRNIGSNSLNIEDIKAGCFCTVPLWENKSIEASDSLVIKVEFQKTQLGYFHQKIRIYSNSVSSPDILILKGTVISELD
jgi:hypothetical protein